MLVIVERKMIMEHTIKPCPFCGNEVYLQKVPLWSEGGHGYYGCYEYKIECEKCGCNIWCGNTNTIYNTDKIAKDNMIKAWNRRA